jgi:signal transduction histidine kinase
MRTIRIAVVNISQDATLSVEGFVSPSQLGLFDTPPNQKQVRFGLSIVGLMLAAFILILPARDIQLSEIPAFVPITNTIMILGDLMVATMIYAQATVFRSQALTVLASGFVYSALVLVAHALTFPGAFAPTGLLGAGVNTTAWLAFLWRLALPLSAIPYAVLKSAEPAASLDAERRPARVLPGVLAAIALAALVVVLSTRGHGLLPPLFLDRREGVYPNLVLVNVSTIALTTAAMAILIRKRESVLDMWLLVALSGWLIEQVLNVPLHARFTVGWYGLWGMMFVANLTVTLALIAESTLLYARLARSLGAREREREARMMSMDAVAAAIAHEVGQPLAAVNLSAKTGLEWLTRARPNPEMAIKSFRDTVEAGQRSFAVLRSIRGMFSRGTGGRSDVSLNELVHETVSLLDRVLTAEGVTLQLTLDETLPPILANRVQLQQVLFNLLTNAIESLSATRRGPRSIAIRSVGPDRETVLLEVSDSGAGIEPEKLEHIFDPFFTTKSAGTGLGLSLSRTIIEGHGGRLWASANEDHGATFHLQLPARVRAPMIAE